MREKSRMFIDEDGIVVRKTATQSQLVLPKKFHALIYRELHEEMGHLGVERTLQLVRTYNETSIIMSPRYAAA